MWTVVALLAPFAGGLDEASLTAAVPGGIVHARFGDPIPLATPDATALLGQPQPPEPAQPTEPEATKPSTSAAPVPAALAPATSLPTPDRWLMMRALQGTYAGALLDDHRMQILGWTDVGFTASSDRFSNLPLGLNYVANEPVLQQNWLRFERTVVTTGTTEPTFGFRLDTILPGTDYRFTLPRGLFNSQLTANHGQPDLYGIDLVQFYAEMYDPTVCTGLDLKIGRFYAQYGVQSMEAPNNALFSHSYTFLDNPFTQTGVLATATLSPVWTVQAGLVNGQDVFLTAGMEPNFIGSVKWTSPDQRDALTLATILCSGRFNRRHDLNDANVLDVVYTHKVNTRLTYTIESLGGGESNVPDVGTANWFGAVNYLTYVFTPRLSGTTRLEFWDDMQGTRTGSPGLYTVPTLGLQIKMQSGLIFRPEIRYDYNNETPAFERHHGLVTAGADMIVRW